MTGALRAPALTPDFSTPLMDDEETLDSYEVGLKTTFGNGRYRFNASGFYYNYDDFQVFSFLGLSQFISNADATYFGGEIEATASLFEGFDVHLAASYLDTTTRRQSCLLNSVLTDMQDTNALLSAA